MLYKGKLIHHKLTILDNANTIGPLTAPLINEIDREICVVFEYDDKTIPQDLFNEVSMTELNKDASSYMKYKIENTKVNRQNVLYKYEKILEKTRKEILEVIKNNIAKINTQRSLQGMQGVVKYFIIPIL